MEKQRCCRNDGGNGSHCGKHRSESGIEAAMANVGGRQAFIDDRALLEEEHPGRDGRADIGHDQQDKYWVKEDRLRYHGAPAPLWGALVSSAFTVLFMSLRDLYSSKISFQLEIS